MNELEVKIRVLQEELLDAQEQSIMLEGRMRELLRSLEQVFKVVDSFKS
jgi:hypothetical protein